LLFLKKEGKFNKKKQKKKELTRILGALNWDKSHLVLGDDVEAVDST